MDNLPSQDYKWFTVENHHFPSQTVELPAGTANEFPQNLAPWLPSHVWWRRVSSRIMPLSSHHPAKRYSSNYPRPDISPNVEGKHYDFFVKKKLLYHDNGTIKKVWTPADASFESRYPTNLQIGKGTIPILMLCIIVNPISMLNIM